MSKRKPVVNLMEALKKSLEHLNREKPMTPEDTPRMAERTDRQAQIDPWKEIKAAHIYDVMTAEDESLGCDIVRAEESELNVLFCCQWNGRKGEDMCPDCRAMQARIERSLVHCIESASAVLLRERDAQIASLTAQVEGLQDKWTGGWTRETALAQVDDFDRLCQTIATLRAERDAAQQENTELRQARDEANAVIARYGFNGAKLQVERLEQENQTLREAPEDVVGTIGGWHKGSIGSIGNVYVGSFGVERLNRLRAALSSSPRPQEPQPAEPKSSETRKPVVNLMEALKKSLDSLNAKPSQEPGGHQP